ncbi:MAG: DUF4382 domain-containing protein [Gammaproteobacteria bacterium]|jgi:hypothetical protein|nr:DUF4382 domain-containing protein [Gammaproteobacteria bacterium]
MKITPRISLLSLPMALGLTLAGCGGDDAPGSLSLAVTDAPVASADEVVFTYTGGHIHGGEGEDISFKIDPPRQLNMLELSDGQSVVILDKLELPAGHYQWIRLETDLAPEAAWITIDGQRHPLSCPSCDKNGLKLHRAFDVDPGGHVAFTVDWELNKAISKPVSKEAYTLRPTARIVDTQTVGAIAGQIDGSTISGLGGIASTENTGCAVYVYEGDVIPDDVFIPDSGESSGHTNPESVARVRYRDDLFRYRAAFLEPGEYTASLTCNAATDDPVLNQDDILFTGTSVVAVEAAKVTKKDF